MTATLMNGDLADEVRKHLEDALREGRPTPGRPALVRLTGATDHAIKKVLVEVTGAPGPRHQRPGDGSPAPRQQHQTPNTSLSLVPNTSASPSPELVPVPQPLDTPVEHQPSTLATDLGSPLATPAPAVDSAGAPAGGRLVAWTGFVFGSVMSIAANVLHTWLPAAHEPVGWVPSIASQVGAAAWPLALLLAVEVLSRVNWPSGFGWNLARYGGAGTVAVSSALISYGHVSDVLTAWKYTPIGAAVGPLVLDGLMVVSGFALLAIGHQPATGGAPVARKQRTRKTKRQRTSAPEDHSSASTSAPEGLSPASDAGAPDLTS